MIKLYIDDVRNPKTEGWVVTRSYDETIKFLEKNGCPAYISFDHDLGEEKSGYDIAKWVVRKDMDEKGFIPENFNFNVHSANPIGKANIELYIKSYLKCIKLEKELNKMYSTFE